MLFSAMKDILNAFRLHDASQTFLFACKLHTLYGH